MFEFVQPHRRQPTRVPRSWDSPGKNTGVGCQCLLQCMKVKSESEVAQSVQLLATPWTAAHQAPPSMGFSRQEYWSGVPLPSPIKLKRCLQLICSDVTAEYTLQKLPYLHKETCAPLCEKNEKWKTTYTATQGGMAASCGKPVLSFVRNCQTVFQNCCILYSYWG